MCGKKLSSSSVFILASAIRDSAHLLFVDDSDELLRQETTPRDDRLSSSTEGSQGKNESGHMRDRIPAQVCVRLCEHLARPSKKRDTIILLGEH